MAKEKLFTPEDFDKPKEKKWYQSKSILIALVLFAIAIIVGLLVYFSSDNSNEEAQSTKSNETVVESLSMASSEVEAVDSSAIETAPENVQHNIEQDDTSLSSSSEKVNHNEISVETKQTLATVTESTESEALKVIRGDYGNVPQRKELLGTRFNEIQDRVNQLKREGKF